MVYLISHSRLDEWNILLKFKDAQNAMNQGGAGQAMQQQFTGMQSGGMQSGGMVKPGDKVEAQNAMQGTQSGGMVKPGDKIEARNRM